MNQEKKWIINKKKSIFKAKLFELFELDCFLPSKKMQHKFLSIDIRNWANVFAITKDQKAIMVKQHRIGKDIVTLEVPAGAIENGEEPEVAARRELVEETGYTATRMILIKKIAVNPAIQTNTCYFFLALDCIKEQTTHFDPAEEIEVELKELQEVFDYVSVYQKDNIIDNSLAFLAITLVRDYLKNNMLQ